MRFSENLRSEVVSETIQHLVDIEKMTPEELRQKYQMTWDTWRNRKHHCRRTGAEWAVEFESFSGFLGSVGPRPGQRWTLDRIDNRNPNYGPGLVRWLDKRGQANNRSSTIYLTYAGETLPLTIWADRIGVSPSTLRNRRDRGWSDEEIILGRRRDGAGRFGNVFHYNFWPEIWPSRPEAWRYWERQYHSNPANLKVPRIEFILAESRAKIDALEEEISEVPEGEEFNGVRLRILEKLGPIRKVFTKSEKLKSEAHYEYKAWVRRRKRNRKPIDIESYRSGNPDYRYM